MSIDSRIPEPVRPILETYISLTKKHVPDLLRAFYIVGSIALGEFNERFSDIDFVALLSRRTIPPDLYQLGQIHQRIENNYPRWKMSGSYLQPSDLGKLDDIQAHPHYHDGMFQPDAVHDVNSLTWWELKNHGSRFWEQSRKICRLLLIGNCCSSK